MSRNPSSPAPVASPAMLPGWNGHRRPIWTVSRVMTLAAGIFLIGSLQANQAKAQTPPWQQPPTSESFRDWQSGSECDAAPACSPPSGRTCGEACGSGGPCCDSCNADSLSLGSLIFGSCCNNFPHDDWARFDALLWWTKGAHIPALLTTSPDGTPQAQAGVARPARHGRVVWRPRGERGFRAGGRISLGTWLDAGR